MSQIQLLQIVNKLRSLTPPPRQEIAYDDSKITYSQFNNSNNMIKHELRYQSNKECMGKRFREHVG